MPLFGINHLPLAASRALFKEFMNPGSITPWRKPVGRDWLFILAISGGSGGGGGFTGAAASARGGGGGGSSGSITTLLIPMIMVPEELYIQVGNSGAGAVAGGTGLSGTTSTVGIHPNSVGTSSLVTSGAGNGGSPGSATAGGAGGGAPTPVSRTNNLFGMLGVWTTATGVAGAAGGAQTGLAGTAAGPMSSHILSAGSGGGGVGTSNTDFAGGAQSVADSQIWTGTVPGGVAAAGRGVDGIYIERPFFSFGGTGGGTAGASGTAGRGGNGSIGSGGGGGGGGVTGGAGGDGGPGYVLLAAL